MESGAKVLDTEKIKNILSNDPSESDIKGSCLTGNMVLINPKMNNVKKEIKNEGVKVITWKDL